MRVAGAAATKLVRSNPILCNMKNDNNNIMMWSKPNRPCHCLLLTQTRLSCCQHLLVCGGFTVSTWIFGCKEMVVVHSYSSLFFVIMQSSKQCASCNIIALLSACLLAACFYNSNSYYVWVCWLENKKWHCWWETVPFSSRLKLLVLHYCSRKTIKYQCYYEIWWLWHLDSVAPDLVQVKNNRALFTFVSSSFFYVTCLMWYWSY